MKINWNKIIESLLTLVLGIGAVIVVIWLLPEDYFYNEKCYFEEKTEWSGGSPIKPIIKLTETDCPPINE